MMPSPSELECKICGARASQAQLRDGAHISSVLCDLNKEVNDLKDEFTYLERLKENLSAEIKELDYPGLGEDIIPSRDGLRYAIRSLKAEIKSSSQVVTQLEQVKEAITIHRVTQGLPLTHNDRRLTLNIVR